MSWQDDIMAEDMPEEEWRDVLGFEELYQVSNLGKVRTIKKGEVEMTQQENRNGYMTVHLRNKGVERRAMVHRLVAEAFISNPDNKPQVNHIDGNPLNNCKENLEWATAQENIRHKYDVLKYTSPTRKAVRCVETGMIYESISAAANDNSLSVGSLSSVLKGGYGRKTLGGCHWEYVDEPEVVYPSNDNELVIHFEDTNECQDFYNKLLAWKRLKDKGFRFEGWTIDDGLRISICTNFDSDGIYDEDSKETKKDLDICFGGEE